MAKAVRRLRNPALFICDLQEKFRPAIHQYPQVISTSQKMLKASQILDFPVFATTQQKAKLGETCTELGLDAQGGFPAKVHADKSKFSMWIPEVEEALKTHRRVPQQPTTLDLLRAGHHVYVLADGVSSCNKEEVPIALARMRAEGAVVTTSESWLYECMGDAGIDEFRAIVGLVKETKESTRDGLQALCKI